MKYAVHAPVSLSIQNVRYAIHAPVSLSFLNIRQAFHACFNAHLDIT